MEADYRMEKSAPKVSDQGAIYEQYMELTFLTLCSDPMSQKSTKKLFFFLTNLI